MVKKYFICGCLLTALIFFTDSRNNPCGQKSGEMSAYKDHYPSYQCINSYGQFDNCLRACHDLPPGVIVGAADFVKTENEFIALHTSKEFRHVAIMGLKKDGTVQWGRVNGKMALVNHSCDPNCELTADGCVVTIKNVNESEELTIAYDAPIIGVDWNPLWNFACLCKSTDCRNILDSYDWNKKPKKLAVIE